MNVITQLKDWGIPTDYDVVAVQAIRNHDPSSGLLYTEELTAAQQAERIGIILGIEPPKFTNDKHARLLYAYAVGMTVAAQAAVDPADVFAAAQKTIGDMPWCIRDYEVFTHTSDAPPKLDAQGNVKKKKGAKKLLAVSVYNRDKHMTDRTRKQWIEVLVAEVGLSPAGASTYLYSLKKGLWG